MKINYFNFKKWKKGFLLTNEQGFYSFVDYRTFQCLQNGRFEGISKEKLIELQDRYFLFDVKEDVFIERAMLLYRNNRQYLFSATCLHIFVLTNMCNMCCVYCQAQVPGQRKKGSMDFVTAQKAVEIALQSPERELTFEFQGGEPLAGFKTIKFIVEYANTHCNDKVIHYSLVTNTLLLDEEMIRFFQENKISVSTSVDGDKYIHNLNRPKKNGQGTYEEVADNIRKMQNASIYVGAIQTTTKASLSRHEQIVDAYRSLGLTHLFVRLRQSVMQRNTGMKLDIRRKNLLNFIGMR